MNDIKKAVEVFNQGGIVIFPTDTAFGIGCRIDREESIKKLLSIRRRPVTQPTSVLVSSIAMAKHYADISTEVEESLLRENWPGGLTVVLPINQNVSELLQKDAGIGIRQPNHPDLLRIIEEVGVPILGPSANFQGEKTPFKFEDLDPNLVSLCDYLIKGDAGGESASTVVSTMEKPWKILRQGPVLLKI